MYKLICSFRQVKIFFGQVCYGHLLVPEQVEFFTISTPLIQYIPYVKPCSCSVRMNYSVGVSCHNLPIEQRNYRKITNFIKKL